MLSVCSVPIFLTQDWFCYPETTRAAERKEETDGRTSVGLHILVLLSRGRAKEKQKVEKQKQLFVRH